MPFEKGNPGGPGRPKKTVEEKYTKAVYSAIKPDDLKEVVDAILKAARRGDMRAAKLILDYTVGTPVQKTEISGADGSAMRITVEYADQTNPPEVPQQPTRDTQ